ncbi:hypothetical protein F4678DRAFT_461315 [Xylaria arbuscula]|nr:hypothetical protein F4678DRAFT_461315 [Xylaria arbuscula]
MAARPQAGSPTWARRPRERLGCAFAGPGHSVLTGGITLVGLHDWAAHLATRSYLWPLAGLPCSDDVAAACCGLVGHWDGGGGALTRLGCSLTTTPRGQSGDGQEDQRGNSHHGQAWFPHGFCMVSRPAVQPKTAAGTTMTKWAADDYCPREACPWIVAAAKMDSLSRCMWASRGSALAFRPLL